MRQSLDQNNRLDPTEFRSCSILCTSKCHYQAQSNTPPFEQNTRISTAASLASPLSPVVPSDLSCSCFKLSKNDPFTFDTLQAFCTLTIVRLAALTMTSQAIDMTELPERPFHESRPSWFNNLTNKASGTHSKVPGVNKLAFPAVCIIVLLIFVNVTVWIVAGVVLVSPYYDIKLH